MTVDVCIVASTSHGSTVAYLRRRPVCRISSTAGSLLLRFFGVKFLSVTRTLDGVVDFAAMNRHF